VNPGETSAENPVPFWQPPVVDASMPPPLAPGVPERVPGFRADQAERTEAEPLSDFDTSPDAPSFEPVKEDPEYSDPVPVVLVAPAPLQERIRDWASVSYTVGSDKPVMILGANRNRIRAVIGVGGTEGVAVALMRSATDVPNVSARFSGVGTASGYAVSPTVELYHNSQVWARVVDSDDPTATVTLEVITEFWVEDIA